MNSTSTTSSTLAGFTTTSTGIHVTFEQYYFIIMTTDVPDYLFGKKRKETSRAFRSFTNY